MARDGRDMGHWRLSNDTTPPKITKHRWLRASQQTPHPNMTSRKRRGNQPRQRHTLAATVQDWLVQQQSRGRTSFPMGRPAACAANRPNSLPNMTRQPKNFFSGVPPRMHFNCGTPEPSAKGVIKCPTLTATRVQPTVHSAHHRKSAPWPCSQQRHTSRHSAFNSSSNPSQRQA